ncbi:MAG: GrpB family protein [Patescibacteria group bacterium]|nr:GrpB family protein [Patescibacteria group bacterium]
MTPYEFLPYDVSFPKLFEKEEKRLRSILGDQPVIEHFGSSAVPGLGGKGFIDIYIAVPKEDLKAVSEKLQTGTGYEYKKDAGVEGERLFHKINIPDETGRERTYHTHVTYLGNQNFRECIALRDYLRAHPDEAQRYADVKIIAAEEANEESDGRLAKEKYLEVKGEIIREMIQKALEEFPNAGR